MFLMERTARSRDMNKYFWNPVSVAFEAAYYLTQTGFTGYDFVTIWLGTNEITYTTDMRIKHINDTT